MPLDARSRPLLLLLASLAVAACAGGEDDAARPPSATAEQAPTATAPTGTADEGPGETGAAPATGTTRTEPPPEPERLGLEPVASGLEAPTHLAVAPGDADRLYVVEQAGRIRVSENGRVSENAFLDIRELVASGGERGLLSLAFHPDYEDNGRFYVDYTNRDGDTRVVEYRANRERTAAEEGSARVLLAVDQPYANHNGGQLAFGPDGLLYVGMGDGGSGGDPENRAQNLDDRLGKLLRLDVDEPGSEWETVAYGLRNPWRFSFDRETGDLYVADVGQSAREEVNYVPWPPGELLNFGWDVYEGDLVYEEKEPNAAGRLVRPVAVYGRDGGCSVTGGFAYRGSAMPGLHGRYFYGDYCSGTVWSFRVLGGKARATRREPFRVPALSSFGEDADGELYLVSQAGTIYRLAG
jgi:glucose/arabinose dehydrogenase